MSNHYIMTGVVEGVRAQRIGDHVEHLTASLRFEREDYRSNKWDKEKRIDHMDVALPPDSPVNAGDEVVMSLSFDAPEGQRFIVALPMSVSDTLADE